MTLRVYVPYDIKPETPLDAISEAVAWKAHYRGRYVRAGAVKVFMDGVLESTTALMVDDYAELPGNRGKECAVVCWVRRFPLLPRADACFVLPGSAVFAWGRGGHCPEVEVGRNLGVATGGPCPTAVIPL